MIHVGASIELEDLGSANGSRVKKRRLDANERAEITLGQVFELGTTMMIVQHATVQTKPGRLFTHGYFEMSLEQACTAAIPTDTRFAVLRVHVDGGPAGHVVQEIFFHALSPRDIVALYAPGDYELHLADAEHRRASDVAATIEAGFVRHNADVEVGIALYPNDGRTPEALITRACAAVRGAESSEARPEKVIVEDPNMRDLYRVAQRIARGSLSVLLLGETGVGKELFAEMVHRSSKRRDEPFVRLNCAALSETLLESELFGHEKGAFTGAVDKKPGLLEVADGGTVMLDELGEMPLVLQAKLLRVIEQRQVLRVGGLKPRDVDVRFVSATNRDLEKEVDAGRFRADLFYRLNGVSIVIPPLRERVLEIEPLATLFIAKASREMDLDTVPVISKRALQLLEEYAWPGNIRELRNMMERAVLLCTGSRIEGEHLPLDKLTTTWGPAKSSATSPAVLAHGAPPDMKPRDIEKRKRIIEALDRSHGNQTKAAELLGVSRRTLSTWLDKYKIARPRKGSAGQGPPISPR